MIRYDEGHLRTSKLPSRTLDGQRDCPYLASAVMIHMLLLLAGLIAGLLCLLRRHRT